MMRLKARIVALLLVQCLLLGGCSMQHEETAAPDTFVEKTEESGGAAAEQKEEADAPKRQEESAPPPKKEPEQATVSPLPSAFEPVMMTADGRVDGLFNAAYAEQFWETVVLTAEPAEEQAFTADSSFTLLEAVGEEREEYTCEVSAAQRLLRVGGDCYRLTEEAAELVRELTLPSEWISSDAEDSALEEDAYMVITALYEDFFLATLSEDPAVTVKVNLRMPELFYKTVGDEVAGDHYNVKREGDRIETVGVNLMTAEERAEMEPNTVYG